MSKGNIVSRWLNELDALKKENADLRRQLEQAQAVIRAVYGTINTERFDPDSLLWCQSVIFSIDQATKNYIDRQHP